MSDRERLGLYRFLSGATMLVFSFTVDVSDDMVFVQALILGMVTGCYLVWDNL